MAGRDDAMDAIVQDERARLVAEVTGPAPEGAPRGAAPAEPHGEARDSHTATRRGSAADAPTRPDPGTDAPPFTSRAVRSWQRLYGEGSLPRDLAPRLRQVDPDRGIITLTDGVRLHDRGARIEASRTSAEAVRLIIAQARAKGWSGLSIRGDEAFLRLAARIAVDENVPVEGRTPEMEAIVADEVRRHYDDLVMAAGDDAGQAGAGPSGAAGSVPRKGADEGSAPGDDVEEVGADVALDDDVEAVGAGAVPDDEVAPEAEAEPGAQVDDDLGM